MEQEIINGPDSENRNEQEDCDGCRRNEEKEDDHAMDSTFISFLDPYNESFAQYNLNEMEMLDEEGFEIF